MRLAVSLAAAAAALALLLAFLARGEDGARDAVVTEPRAEPPPASAPAELVREEERAREVDTPEPEPVEPGSKAAAPRRSYPVRGTAVDAGGAPVTGVGLAAATDGPGAAPRGLTGTDGSFAFELPRAAAQLVAADPAYLVLSGGAFRAESAEPLRLVLAPRGRFEGSVVDARTGEPVPGALVRAVAPPALAWTPGEEGETHTRADGGFALEAVPALPGVRLSATSPGYLETVLEPPLGASHLGQLPLEPSDPPRAEGRVLLPDGTPAGGAEVALGPTYTRTRTDGTFVLSVPRPEPGAELRARLAPHGPALAAGAGARLLAGESVLGLELVLSAEGIALEGRVVDATGEPFKGCVVEAFAPGAAEPSGRSERTRKDGTFRIAGLVPGPYALAARGRSPAEAAFMSDVAAPAAGLQLVLSAAARRVSGVVLRPDGAPAAGREVELLMPVAHARLAQTAADAAGRFAFEGAPGHALVLRVPAPPGEGALPLTVQVQAGASADVPLRLAAARTLRFEALGAAAPPDALFAVDAAGAPVPLVDSAGRSLSRAELFAGRSAALRAPESAAFLVLSRGGRALARIPLAPDGSGVVRW